MSPGDPVNDCCGALIMAGARFCVKCGRELSSDEKARAMPRPVPPPLPDAIDCQSCGVAIPVARLIEPLYEMFGETPEDNEARHRRPQKWEVAAGEGKTLLPNLDNIESYLRVDRFEKSEFMREQIWQAKLKSDPVVAAFDRAARIVRANAPPRGGYSGPVVVVRPCDGCGQADPAGLAAAIETARKRINTRQVE